MRTSVACLAVLVLASSSACGNETTKPPEAGYVFTVNGEPITPDIISMHDDPAHPQPGDLLCFGPLLLTLGPERKCHFLTTSKDDARVFLQLESGAKRVVGVNVSHSVNPLVPLSPAEIRGLWGIYLNEWPEGVSERLKHIDPARACLTLTDGTATKDQSQMPSLPADIRYLCIEEHSNTGIRSYEAMRGLSQLVFLAVSAMTAESFDAGLIAQNQSLRYLQLRTCSLRHPEALGHLARLACLDLAYIPDLSTVAFAANMPQLQRLFVPRTAITDLSPLGNLDKLQEVVASMTPLAKLPERPLPALHTLEVFGTDLSESAVVAFAQRNPQCTVRFRWDDALRRAVAGATRLRVRSGGTCHRDVSREQTLWALTDAAKIAEFAALIHIDEKASGFECMCCGHPTFEFYQGDRLVAMLGFHHGRSLRWPGHWPGDALLTPQTQNRLPQWLAENGFDRLQKDKEAALKEKEQEEEQRKLLLSFFPEKARDLFDAPKSATEGSADRTEAIVEASGGPVEAMLAVCRGLGAADRSWSFSDRDDAMVFSVAHAASNDDFLKALRQLRGDRPGELGAAQLCFARQYLAKIPEAERGEWAVHLAKAVLEGKQLGRKQAVLAQLATLRDAKTAALLRQMARGEVPQEPQLWNHDPQEPGLRTGAYLALAAQKDRSLQQEVEKLLPEVPAGPDRAALEVALVWLGNPQFIKREHFRFSSETIGSAAIRAIETFGGREGLEVLVEAGLEHPWAGVVEEAILAVQRLTGQTWCKDPKRERAYNSRGEVQRWWRVHGEEFVRQQRAKQ